MMALSSISISDAENKRTRKDKNTHTHTILYGNVLSQRICMYVFTVWTDTAGIKSISYFRMPEQKRPRKIFLFLSHKTFHRKHF